jgi:hypothetical protein
MFNTSKVIKPIVATNPLDCRIDAPYSMFFGVRFVIRALNRPQHKGNKIRGDHCKVISMVKLSNYRLNI